MAKVVPSYDQVKYSGVAAGDDIAPDGLATYDDLKYSGISMSSQVDRPAMPTPTAADVREYPSMQDPGSSGVPGVGADTMAHGVGPVMPKTPGGSAPSTSGITTKAGNKAGVRRPEDSHPPSRPAGGYSNPGSTPVSRPQDC